MGVDSPVFLLLERADLAFPLHDQPDRDGLHASGGKAAAHLVPQERRNLEPYQPIENAAGLLRVHQVAVNVARLLERVLYRLLRNFVEDALSRP
jgi:hypothetical protein